MEKQSVDKYIVQEVLNGKSHQEIYDHIIATSTFEIHNVAEGVRKIPTLKKRKKYRAAQILLLVMIGLLTTTRIPTNSETWIILDTLRLTVEIVSFIILLCLFYGIATYKRNMHLVVGIWMIFVFLLNVSILFVNVSRIAITGLIIGLFSACLAFYLNNKLSGDYIVDQELQENDPKERKNLIRFVD